MTKLLLAALVTISAVVAILASAPGPVRADEIIIGATGKAIN